MIVTVTPRITLSTNPFSDASYKAKENKYHKSQQITVFQP